MRKSLAELLAADGRTVFDHNFWNNSVRAIDAQLAELQGIKISFEALSDDALTLALERINDAILPAAQRIRALSELGFLTAGSSTAVTLEEGAIAQFTLSDDGRDQLFSPSKWVTIARLGSAEDVAIGRVQYLNRETRQFEVLVDRVMGSPGPHADWEFISNAGVVEAQRLLYEETRDRAIVVGSQAEDVGGKHAEVVTKYTQFAETWYGRRSTAPSGAAIGSLFLDTSTTPNLVKVLTSTGWSPATSVSIAGVRRQDYVALGGQTAFTVDGGFSVGDVSVNGLLLAAGTAVTLNPTAGTFTLAEAATAGARVSFRGYLANDISDLYTKAEVNGLLAPKASTDSPTLTGEPSAPTPPSGNKTTRIATTKFVDDLVSGRLVPPGAVAAFVTATAPTGWLKANGQAVSRTTYSNLFAMIGVRYGAGDGTSTFNVPDLRGEFIRAWDDGRGVDPDRTLGSDQAQEIQSHSHAYTDAMAGGGNGIGPGVNYQNVDFPRTTFPAGGNETRPRNVALLYCIKT